MPKIPLWIFLLLAAVYFTAARVDIMDVDASQYAEMTREMAHTQNYLHIYDHGADYLDKPPFLFWVSSVSMQVFGFNNFGYRFPSILFAFLALYATYRLTKLFYDEATARMAALILGVCQGLFLMTNDVRTDTILMSCVVTAMWCIQECSQKRRWYFVLGGCGAIACGLMTKGPVALFVPIFGFGAHWLLQRNWKAIFSPWHLLDLAIILLMLMPMCIGLYQQFDLHPEKWINGSQNVSGIRFFFWTQSFGRITGENAWDNGADMSFLLVNMLWAFLPWILLFLVAVVLNVKSLITQKFLLPGKEEWVSTGGFILTYLALSRSHYQLPHYIFVAFPLAAIMVAALLRDFFSGKYPRIFRLFTGIQTGMGALLLIAALLTLTIVFPAGWMGILLWCLAVVLWMAVTFGSSYRPRILWTSVAAMILANIFLTNHFYYHLLGWQAGSQVGKYLKGEHIPLSKVFVWRMHDPLDALDFYGQAHAPRVRDSIYPPAKVGNYLLTMEEGLAAIRMRPQPFKIIKEGRLFKVSELTPGFLNHKTRKDATQTYYLLQFQ